MAFDSQEKERWSWTENRVHELRRLIEEGLCSPQIAERIGAPSEHSVRSAARRNGLRLAKGNGRPALHDGVRTDRREDCRIEQRKTRVTVEYWPPIALPVLRYVETPGPWLRFLDLPEEGACRWPMSAVHEPGSVHTPFCGCGTSGLVYCPSHEALARRGEVRELLSLVAA